MQAAKSQRVAVGGASRQILKQRLAQAGVQLNGYAHQLLEHDVFDEPQPASDLMFTTCSVADLGSNEGATLSQIYAQAENAGLRICPPVAGPYLRLAYLGQESSGNSVLRTGFSPADALNVSARSLGDATFPKGFYLRVVDGVPWLRGYCCEETYFFAPEDRFIFADPR